MITCTRCGRKWEKDSEQAAAMYLYRKCIVCCVEAEKTKNFIWSIDKVLKKQKQLQEKN